MSLPDLITESIENANLGICDECPFSEICLDNQMYCLNAIKGILNDEDWEPKTVEDFNDTFKRDGD